MSNSSIVSYLVAVPTLIWTLEVSVLKTSREPTSGLLGKAQPLTKLKPSKVQRMPIPGST